LSWWSEWPIIDIEGIYETNILQDQISRGQDTNTSCL
jgi:hypothetical protein